MNSLNSIFSLPLQHLINEHGHLRKAMSHFYEMIEEIEIESGPTVVQYFFKLHQQIEKFSIMLKGHSECEEKWLFPMMERHLGENAATIKEMEREHEKAEKHLQDFLTEAVNAGETIDEKTAQWITVFALQAHTTLTEHFAKEEKSLFPLAEEILTIDEKQELERLIQER